MKRLKKWLMRLVLSPVLLVLFLLIVIGNCFRYKYRHLTQENEICEIVVKDGN